MTNIVQHQSGTGEPHASNHGLAAGELAIKQKATAHTTTASGKLYYGEDVSDLDSSSSTLRTFGFGITSGLGTTQTGVPIGGNLNIAAGSGITTTGSVSGDAVTVTIASTVSAADFGLSGTDSPSFLGLTIGGDSDGTDRNLIFGHGTIKTIMGIDDSADVFAINTDGAFETGNDFEIDASGNVTISRGSIIVANGEVKTPTIAFSDGDNAITIADGGACTFPQAAVFSSGLTGNVTGNASGTAATVTTAAQPNITSLGTLTTLTVDDITINGSSISDSGDFHIDSGGTVNIDSSDGLVHFKDDGTHRVTLNITGSAATDFGSGVSHASGAYLYLNSSNGNTDRGNMLVLGEGSGDHMTALRAPDSLSADLVYFLPSSAPTAGQSLIATTVNSTPTDYTLAWGTLGVAGGGTGATTLTSGGLLYGNGTSAVAGSSYISITESATASGLKITTPSDTDGDYGFLKFEKTAHMDTGDIIGAVTFYGEDTSGSSGTPEGWAAMYAKAMVTTNNSEDANLCFETVNNGTVYVMQHRYTGNTEYYWPSDDGGADEVLTSNGSGVLSWENVGSLGGGGENNQTLTSGTGLSGANSGSTGNITFSVDASQTQITSVGTIGTGTWQGTAIASAYLDSDTAHLSTTQTFSGAKTFSSLTSFTMDGNTITGVDNNGEFTNDNAHIMTSAAIEDKITGYGYTTNTGDITGVTAGTGLSGGGSSGGVTLAVDASQTQITAVGTIGTGTWQGTAIAGGYIANDAIDSEHYAAGSIDNEHIADDAINSEHYAAGSIDNEHIADDAINSEHYAAGSIDEEHLNSSNTPQDNYLLSYNASTAGFTWVVSPSGGGGDDNESAFKTFSVSGQSDVVADADADTMTFAASGGMTITTNASTDTITFSSANDNTTYSTFAGSTTPGTAALVPARDAGNTTGKYLREDGDWVVPPDTNSNTTYSAGSLLDLSSTTFNVDLSELTDGTSDIDSNDEVVYLDNGSQKRKAFSELKLSEFNNDSGFTTNTGDITGVTAGTGMSGGGTSGGVTLTNAGVTSIVAGSGISISGATGAVTVTASGGGGGGSGTVNSGTATALTHYASTGTAVDDTITSTASLTADLTGNLPELMLYREDTSVSGTNGIARLEMGNTDFSSGRTAPNFQIQAQSGGVSQSSGSEGGCSVLFKSISTGSSTLTTRMKLGTDGEVQDNNGDPAFIKNMQLSPGGTGTMLINQVGAGAFTFDSVSDETVKHERRAFDYGLKEIELLQPEHYKFNKEAYDELGITPQPEKHHEVEHQGLMAQDIEKIMPELVYDNALNVEGVKNYHRDGITAALINAVKELSARVAELEEEKRNV